MSAAITGIVANGVVIPSSPLPEGAQVEIHVYPAQLHMPPELQEEFDDWERACAGSLEMIERLAEEREAHEPR